MHKYKYHVHNYMEDVVAELIRLHQKKNPDLCYCPRCIMDINALVLNKAKPQYIRIETKVEKLDPKLTASLEDMVNQACQQVRENPHHDDDFDTQKIFLENLSERLVEQVLIEVLEERDDLDFDQDMLPIIAGLVLNQVKPRYAVTDRGGAYMRLAELEHQFFPATIAVIYNVLNQLDELE